MMANIVYPRNGADQCRRGKGQTTPQPGWSVLQGLTGILLFSCLAIFGAQPGYASDDDLVNLKRMSLEDLGNLEVSSVSKKLERLSTAPAAIYVITGEDIRRSGHISIPEALRGVPGVQVARIDANKWAITARGFNGNFANKLLVLIDGRSVYTPLFSGVYWDVQDLPLEDVDRIEVIRGPGAALWGANAVNGVINIITRKASATQCGLATAGIGTGVHGLGTFRYGSELGENTSYRVYGKYFDHDHGKTPDGLAANDSWRMKRAGFRLDWGQSDRDELTFTGDFYDGETGQTYNAPMLTAPWAETISGTAEIRGGHVLGRWNHQLSFTSDLTVQVYGDRTERFDVYARETRSNLDLDIQHRFAPAGGTEILWGAGYRLMSDKVPSTGLIWMSTDNSRNNLFSAFVQTNLILIPERLRMSVGSKFEHNDYTGYEVQPSGRILWSPNNRHSVWVAVSRAVRTPSRAENSIRVNAAVIPPGTPTNPGLLPVATRMEGDAMYGSEYLIAREVGYRIRPGATLSLDLTAYHNSYTDIRSVSASAPVPVGAPPTHLQMLLRANNDLEVRTHGFEVVADWLPTSWLSSRATYSHFHMRVEGDDESVASGFVTSEGVDPRNQFTLRTSLDLLSQLYFGACVRYVSELSSLDISSYTTLDARVAWRPTATTELAVVGKNLSGPSHVEFQSELNSTPIAFERTVYISATQRF